MLQARPEWAGYETVLWFFCLIPVGFMTAMILTSHSWLGVLVLGPPMLILQVASTWMRIRWGSPRAISTNDPPDALMIHSVRGTVCLDRDEVLVSTMQVQLGVGEFLVVRLPQAGRWSKTAFMLPLRDSDVPVARRLFGVV